MLHRGRNAYAKRNGEYEHQTEHFEDSHLLLTLHDITSFLLFEPFHTNKNQIVNNVKKHIYYIPYYSK